MCLKCHGHKIDAKKMDRNAPDCTFYFLGNRSRKLMNYRPKKCDKCGSIADIWRELVLGS